MEDPDQQIWDMSREFTCFLCNGYACTVGSVTVNEAGVQLTNATGQVLEMDPFEHIASVNEVEPPNGHTLVISFHQRYVMLFYLLRKDKLVEILKDAGVYKSEPRLPPEVIGMSDPEALAYKIAHSDQHAADADQDVYEDHMTGRHGHMTSDREVVDDPWDNKLEQDRHIQRRIRQQSILNPIQMLSSIQQERASEIRHSNINSNSSGSGLVDDDYKQLHKYPSSTRQEQKETVGVSSPATPTHKHTSAPKSSSSKTVSDHNISTSGVLSNLKLLFPNHSQDQLVSVLEKCSYDLDSAISAILGEDDLANAFTT